MWPLGNESGYGMNRNVQVSLVRALDATRLLHDEEVARLASWADGGRDAKDIPIA